MHAARAAVCAALLSVLVSSAASAQALQPFQQRALDRMLEAVEPEIRPMLRAQLAPTLAALNEQQVTMMLEAMAADAAQTDDIVDAPAEVAASTEDLAYNRAQFEPMIRRAWAAGRAFDELVAAKLEESCPSDKPFAVFGSAWRYEVYSLSPTWPKVSNSADLDVEIIGASYAPQDGRYDFDFSAVRLDFDEAAVARGVAAACAEYAAIGAAFMAAAHADTGGDDVPPNGERIARDANAQADAVRSRLEAALEAQAPGGNNAIFIALLNGTRVR